MKTFIVPSDLSNTSRNAALYAVQLAAGVENARIILYSVFQKEVQPAVAPDAEDAYVSTKEQMETSLESVKNDMLNTVSSVNISCVAEENSSLIDSLEKFAVLEKADLIIMGISGGSRIDQVLKGSNTLNMVHKNVCPVIIVPPHVHFKSIKNVLIASDFKDVEKSTPIKSIQAVLNLFKPAVHVVNVDPEHFIELSDDYKFEKEKMETILSGYNPSFSFIRQYDFVDAIGQFAADKNIDLILTVPRKHSFLNKLFVTSHTTKLAYHSDLAILTVHE